MQGAATAAVPLIDVSNAFCDRNVCPSVIGDVLVYRDSGHLTATYVQSLAFYFEELAAPLLGN
jgi:hypothetical protein